MYKLWSKWDTDHHSTTARQTCHGCIMGGTGGERCRSVYINLVSVESQLDTASRDHNVTISLSKLDSTFYTNNLLENRFECHIPHITAVLNRSSCHTKGVYIYIVIEYTTSNWIAGGIYVFTRRNGHICRYFKKVISIWMKINPNSICFACPISTNHQCYTLLFLFILFYHLIHNKILFTNGCGQGDPTHLHINRKIAE